MRDLLIISHFAMYSGVSDGSSGERPATRPPAAPKRWVAAAVPLDAPAGGPPTNRPNGLIG